MQKSHFIAFINTPQLWSGCLLSLEQFNLRETDFNNFEISLIPEKLRLGHKVEYIFHQILNACNQFNVLRHNLPIRNGKETLGELDYLVFDAKNQRKLHIELTYKFYLIDTNHSNVFQQLIGPNKNDTFLAKAEKIQHKQFPLLKSPQTKEALDKIGWKANKVEQLVCFKAQVFIPYEAPKTNIHPLNNECIAGKYVSYDGFIKSHFSAFKYYIPSKTDWLLPPNNTKDFINHNTILPEVIKIIHKKKSPMLWMLRPNGNLEKLFVTYW